MFDSLALMRVLHVSSGNLYGGVETLLVTLARFRHLCPDMEPHFALSFDSRVSQELKAAGVPVYHLGNVRASRPWTIWKARKRLLALLRQEKFESVICHMAWSLAVFGPAVRRMSQLVFWMHGWTTGRHWLERWARTVKPDRAICNSQFTASGFTNLFPKMAVEIVYCPVAFTNNEAPISMRAKIRQELNTPVESVTIIQISRMEAWKGHLLHLQALTLLKDLPGWICWFVGGAQRPEEQDYLYTLQQAAVEFGISERVRFLGQRSDVPSLLAAADVFCQPNQMPDSFGIVFIEALLARLPVITTAMGGAQEIIDASCGLLIQPGDTAALAEALRQLILSEALRVQLGSGGPVRAHDLCDPASQLTRLREVLCGTA